AAAAAESLVEQANQLMDAVRVFKVREGGLQERRVSTSSMRAEVAKPVKKTLSTVKPKLVVKPTALKTIPKSGTDNQGWEEF
ncbi:MAG: hypothetical protein Q8J65_09405, partial [Nitrosomonadales bacterium]|nr:hypothetical protein [Nitrosomonadales bacterium]